jgi:hypothetical protein
MDGDTSTNPLVLIVAVPFLIAWVVGVGAWFLGVAEIGAIYLLRDLLFERGPIALRRQIELSPPASPSLGQRTKLNRSHLRFTSPDRAIFASRYTWSTVGWSKSAGPVKGVISWFGSRAEVIVRHPLGLVVFMLAWLTGWTIGTIAVVGAAVFAPNREELVWAVPMALLGGIGGYAMYRFFLWQGRKSAGFVADEVLSHLQS